MLTFTDGPAGGKRCHATRAPKLLRVAIAANGDPIPLARLAEPRRPGRHLTVYFRTTPDTGIRFKPDTPEQRLGLTFGEASYRIAKVQPDSQAEIDRTDRWQAWAKANAARA